MQLGTSAGRWVNVSEVEVSKDQRSFLLTACIPDLAPTEQVDKCRYGFGAWPVLSLFTTEGLPVLPWMAPVFNR
jgi:hypothetical protein